MSILKEQKSQVIKLYKDFTANEISLELGLKRHVIYYCLEKNGIKRRKGGYKKGMLTWNKGSKGICKPNKTSFKKGSIPWNKGIPASKEARKRLSESHVGKIGELASNWQGGISRAYRAGYNSVQYKEWREKVFKRDNYACQKCGVRCGEGSVIYLTAHHIKSFAKFPDLRFDISNGLTVCEDCHCKLDKYRNRFMNRRN